VGNNHEAPRPHLCAAWRWQRRAHEAVCTYSEGAPELTTTRCAKSGRQSRALLDLDDRGAAVGAKTKTPLAN